MPQALWNDVVIAESSATEIVDGNHYFPPDSIKREYFHDSAHTSVCGWKGTARYYDLQVNGKENKQAAWYYPTPKEAAKNITGYIAFWNGVQVKD